MIFGMTTFTFVHTLISLIGIASPARSCSDYRPVI